MNNQPCGDTAAITRNESVDLSASERAIFCEAIEPGLLVRTEEAFVHWAQHGLQKIFPHGMLACGIGVFASDGIDVKHLLFSNFPPAYIETLRQSNGLTNSPLVRQWMQTREPVLFEPDQLPATLHTSPRWLDNFYRYNLINVAAHGQCDISNQTTTYFNFSRIPHQLTQRHVLLLQLLVPYLHNALVRITPNLFSNERTLDHLQLPITKRENEILKCLSTGKTNAEIAKILYVSESTVKKHVQRVMTTLQVRTRTEAVAKAINLRLIGAND